MRILTRRWKVVALNDHDGPQVMESCWTERGARRARHYWYVVFKAVGRRTPLEVIHD